MKLGLEDLKRIKTIQIQSRRLVTTSLMGHYLSRFKGQGLHFEEVREYYRGDDVRHIDWNVTARTGKLHIKRFREERELSICHLIDVSLSMDSGFGRVSKIEAAAEIAGALSYSAMTNQDRVGCGLLADKLEQWIPVRKGRNHGALILRSILSIQCQPKTVDFRRSMEEASAHLPNNSVLFLFSDFNDLKGIEEALRFSRRFDLVPIWIQDPWDFDLPKVGLLQLQDPENPNQTLSIQSYNTDVVKAFLDRKKAHREKVKALFKKHRLDFMEVRAGEDFIYPLTKFFKMRGR